MKQYTWQGLCDMGKTKGELFEFMQDESFDYALPQDWLNQTADGNDSVYHMIRATTVMHYPKTECCGVFVTVCKEVQQLLDRQANCNSDDEMCSICDNVIRAADGVWDKGEKEWRHKPSLHCEKPRKHCDQCAYSVVSMGIYNRVIVHENGCINQFREWDPEEGRWVKSDAVDEDPTSWADEHNDSGWENSGEFDND